MPIPVGVTDMEVAFGGGQLLMPRRDAVPGSFRRDAVDAAPWFAVVDAWRARGVKAASDLVPASGISPGEALRHIAAIINNRSIPAGEATEAAAWLLSEWFIPAKSKA